MKKYISIMTLAVFALTIALPVQAVRPLVTNSLIRCPDFSSVYYLADDETRWVFPDETTYFTWYMDFNDVEMISCSELAEYPIGGVVTYQPGTNLVKLQTAPTVYAVEPGGVLRPIVSEEQAINLYGELWWTYVRDLSDAFWSAYTVGDPLANGEIPVGTVVFDYHQNNITSSQYYYYDGDVLREVTDMIDEAYNDWTITLNTEDFNAMTIGEEMDEDTWAKIKTLSH